MQQVAAPEPGPLEPRHFERVFKPPSWLRDLGFMAWFLVGLLALLVGLVWILGLTSTIVDPVAVGAVVAIVAAPLVSRLQRHRVPRAGGAAIVLVGVIAIVVVIVWLVIAGIADQSAQIKSTLTDSLDTIAKWFNDAGANNTTGATERRDARDLRLGRHGAAGTRERDPQPHLADLLPHVHGLQHLLPAEGRTVRSSAGSTATSVSRSSSRP